MSHTSVLAAVFGGSGLLLLYVYVGYPLLCCLRARVRPRPWHSRQDFRPSVSVVIAAHNEAEHIRNRILNIAAQQPGFPVQILIGSDGSTDATYGIAAQTASEAATPDVRVRVFDFPRAGKLATLARLLDHATGDIVVLTDANCRFAPGALQAVVAPLADPTIGCADGVKRISTGDAQTSGGERTYWGFENRLKSWESAFGSSAGADGALYAVRRRDLPPLMTNRLLADDFYISLAACSNQRRCVLVPDAVALETSDTNGANELRRKARIFAGAFTAILLCRTLLVPGSGFALTLWSHKLLRWFSFLPVCGMLVGATGLPPEASAWFYLATATCAVAVLAGALFPASLRVTPIKLAYYFALMNFGQFLGVFNWIRHGNEPTWEKVR